MMDNKIQIYNDDCLIKLKDIPDNSIDLVLTDPPYNTTNCDWDNQIIPFDEMWKELRRIVKPKGVTLLFSVQPFTTYLISSNLKQFKYTMVWHKSKCGSPLTAKYKPLTKHEDICVFNVNPKHGALNYYPQMREGEPYKRKFTKYKKNEMGFGIVGVCVDNKGTRHPTTILNYPQKWRRQDQLHTAQKPVDLLNHLILSHTLENDTVLDFTMGSGSTGIACIKTNRRFIGIEKEQKYFDIAQKRIKKEKKSII